jgi:F0F1-type ATP synthase assembly protein I
MRKQFPQKIYRALTPCQGNVKSFIAARGGKSVPHEPKPPKPDNQPKNLWKHYGEYSQIALILPASVIAGMILGAILDKWLGTKWIMLTGVVLGAVAGFYQLIRGLMKVSKDT